MDKQTPTDTVKEAASAMQDAARKPMAAAERIAKQAGDTLKSAADRLRARVPESGMAGTVADIVTGGVKQAATRLEEQGFGGIIEDVVAVARRYPVQTLLLGFGCDTSGPVADESNFRGEVRLMLVHLLQSVTGSPPSASQRWWRC